MTTSHSQNVEVGRRVDRAPDGRWSYRPRTDFIETTDGFTVYVDLPGVAADRIEMGYEAGTLTLRCTVPPRQDLETEFLLHEYGVGDFDREFAVPDTVDADGIAADLDRGVLTIHLPKSAAARPRRIPIRSVLPTDDQAHQDKGPLP